ncbi:MAG: glycosyltransferase family 4 protein [Desulfobacteraceae bacterium]|nr:glycosyltransferase family 4 protein [Desulfobacteraceae bacterium]
MASKTFPSVIFLNFYNSGGMTHYAANLHQSVSCRLKAELVEIDRGLIFGQNGQSWSIKSARIPKKLDYYNPLFYKRLAQRLKVIYNPDIVHITSSCPGLCLLLNCLKKMGIKVVWTLHDPIDHPGHRTLRMFIFKWYKRKFQTRWAVRRCDAIHVHSVRHQKDIFKLYGLQAEKKVYVARHGAGLPVNIETGAVKPPELLDVNALNPGLPTVLFFGRIEPYKGLSYLAEALTVLEQSGVKVNLIIAGAGFIPKNQFSNLKSNVILINRFVQDDEIKAIFKSSDIVVLPYSSATQSGVIPLAYALEKPVLVTRAGALEEIVKEGKTGFTVAPCDYRAIARKMAQTFSEPALLQKMGKQAKQYAQTCLSWDKVVQDHIKIYESIM